MTAKLLADFQICISMLLNRRNLTTIVLLLNKHHFTFFTVSIVYLSYLIHRNYMNYRHAKVSFSIENKKDHQMLFLDAETIRERV